MKVSIRLLLTAATLSCFSACSEHSITQPTAPANAAAQPQQASPTVAYEATLVASPTCAENLPPDIRVRHYIATMFQTGKMNWTGPTVQQPPGHALVSSGQINGNTLTFTIGIKDPDPQSDNFHGIWDALDGTRFLTVQGSGSGTRSNDSPGNGQIAGAFAGDFSYFYEIGATGVVGQTAFCTATDHTFTFVPVTPIDNQVRHSRF
jgi:hypothetical protein